MFRGTSEFLENGVVENKFLKMARKPRDTDNYIHEIMDEWFFSNFGIKARSQTIFCSLSKELACKYIAASGGLYHITIPCQEKYSIIFSELVVDLYDIVYDLEYPYNKDDIIEWLSNKNYVLIDNIIDIPIDFKGELMLFVKTYHVEKV
ncbi:hypothetical protein [Yersinia intermedia]|uniref:hypothetical protein n=1 Tax=Yersinia intermedia TaxID=631 RepID=UPI00065CD6B2|nr:hypothetical protein [Yersinia intermedia]CRY84150.1 Uncharacterised protein [Yersinia intermedia]